MKLVEVACPVCGDGGARHLFSVRDYLFRVSEDVFGVKQCRECGVGFLSPRPQRVDMARFYPSEFYWSYEGADDSKLAAQDLLARRAAQIENKLRVLSHLAPGRLLDIGAMKGEFLHVARARGWQASGVEFSQDVANPFNVPMHYGEFLDMRLPSSSFDCVTMWAVLEHVYDPKAYVHEVSRVLDAGGTYIGVVTNFNSIQARLLRADDYPRHLTLFTRRSLARLLREAGLEPVRMWTDQRLFGGALRGGFRYLVKRALGYSADEVLYEMRDRRDPLAFGNNFKGRRSRAMRWVSRLDRVALTVPERLLDLIGCGFNLSFEARKRG